MLPLSVLLDRALTVSTFPPPPPPPPINDDEAKGVESCLRGDLTPAPEEAAAANFPLTVLLLPPLLDLQDPLFPVVITGLETVRSLSFSRFVGKSSNASSSVPSPYCLPRFGREKVSGAAGMVNPARSEELLVDRSWIGFVEFVAFVRIDVVVEVEVEGRGGRGCWARAEEGREEGRGG